MCIHIGVAMFELEAIINMSESPCVALKGLWDVWKASIPFLNLVSRGLLFVVYTAMSLLLSLEDPSKPPKDVTSEIVIGFQRGQGE